MFAHAHREYRDAGLAVLPIVPGTKKPPVRWRQFKNEQPSDDQYAEWEERFGDHDIAVILNGVVDVEEDKQGSLNRLVREHELPPLEGFTWTSPRGSHHAFSQSGEGFKIIKVGGVEFRTGGLSIVPPSRGREALTGVGDLGRLPPEWLGFWQDRITRPGNPLVPRQVLDPECSKTRDISCLAALGTETLKQAQMGAETGGEALEKMYALPEVASRVLTLMGGRLQGAFRAPYRPDRQPSMSALRSQRSGIWVVRDWAWDRYLTLPELRAAMAYGDLHKIGRTELAVWSRRLLWECELLRLPEVPMPSLPSGAPESVRKVYQGLKLLFGIRWLYVPGEPVTFSWRFSSAWCNVNPRTAQSVMKRLLREHVICHSKPVITSNGKKMQTFLPGHLNELPSLYGLLGRREVH